MSKRRKGSPSEALLPVSLFSDAGAGHDGPMRLDGSDTNKAIDRALRRQWMETHLKPKTLIGGAVGLVLFVLLVVAPPVMGHLRAAQQFDGVVSGHTRGSFSAASKFYQHPLYLSVELESGEMVETRLPKGSLYFPDAPVRLKAFHTGEGDDRRVFYRFDSYVQDGAEAGAEVENGP